MSSDLPSYSRSLTLTAQQHKVLALLAEGCSVTAAAAEASVHRNTVRNWHRSVPAFAREYESAISEQAQAWHERVVALAPQALQVLDQILTDSDAASALRLRAALAVLKLAASPQPKPLPALPSLSDKLETAWDRYLARQSGSNATKPGEDNMHNVHMQDSDRCTILHNAPIRRAPEPGRNSECPCGSGLKYKRCCAPYAAPRTTTTAQNIAAAV